MLLINQFFKNIFHKQQKILKSEGNPDFDDDSVVLTFGLTKDNAIDLLLEFKEYSIKNKKDLENKAQTLAKFFFTITSGGINATIIDFLINEMADKENQELFESILYHWLILEKSKNEQNQQKQSEIPLVYPSKVFYQPQPNNAK